MARVIDLTGKLGLGEKPKIIVGGVELTVNDSARRLVAVLGKTMEKMEPADVLDACDTMFDEESRKELEKLDLSMSGYIMLLEAAIDLIMGGGEDSPKAQGTPDTTS